MSVISAIKRLENTVRDQRIIIAKLVEAARPFAEHDWMDAELEDDKCKLTRHSGAKALRAAIAKAKEQK